MHWALLNYSGARNLGIYNCRNTRGGTSKSVHADGRALDVAFPLLDGGANDLGHDLAARLVLNHQALGVQLVIFDRMLWSSVNRTWRKHCGHPGAKGPHAGCSGPHLDHVHIELTWDASKNRPLTAERIEAILGPPGDDVTEQDIEKVAKRVAAILMDDDHLGPVRHHIAGRAEDGARLPRLIRAVADGFKK